MLPLLPPQRSKVRGTRRDLKPRRLRFDVLEDRTLLALMITAAPVEVGVPPKMSNLIPREINNSGHVFGTGTFHDAAKNEDYTHTFVYFHSNRTTRDLGAPLTGLMGESLPDLVGFDMNHSGTVVGSSNDHTNRNIATHAFIYAGGVLRDLGSLGGGAAQALAIDDHGQNVVGWSIDHRGLQVGFLWVATTGEMTNLEMLSDERPHSMAEGISGEWIVGESWGLEVTTQRAWLLQTKPSGSGIMQDLGTLGGTDSWGMGVSSAGSAAIAYGQSKTASGATHAFVYKYDTMYDIGTLGGKDSEPLGIDRSGRVFGNTTNAAGKEHAFVYDTRIHDLGTLGGIYARANGMNDAGQVVGNSYAAEHPRMHAFVYSGGKMVDLNDLLPAKLKSKWELMNGWDINDRGQIVGTGYHNGKSCVFVLTVGSTPDTQGPGTYGVKVTPWRTNAAPKITATINDRAKGGNKIIAAEYFLDPKQTKNGKGIPLDGDFDSPAETVSAVLDAAKFRSLGQGTHRILVHGKDAAGNWGSLVAASFVKDTLGPLTAAVEVSPRQARKAPTLTAVIDDGSKGASKIVAAEYFLDDMPQTAGTGIAMTAGDKQFNEPKENVWAVLTAEAFAGLTTGSHTVYVHGKDAAGNWGRVQAATFVKAATRATPSAVAAASSLDELASSARVNGAAILAFLVDSSAEEREDGQ